MKKKYLSLLSLSLFLLTNCSLAKTQHSVCSQETYEDSTKLYNRSKQASSIEQAVDLLEQAEAKCGHPATRYKLAEGYIFQKQWKKALATLDRIGSDNIDNLSEHEHLLQAGRKAQVYLEMHEAFRQKNQHPNTRMLVNSSPWLPKAVLQLERVRLRKNAKSDAIPKWLPPVAKRIDMARISHVWLEPELIEYHSGLRSGIVDKVDIPVHFDYNNFQLKPSSDGQRELTELEKALLAILTGGDDVTVQIRGHTDSRGSDTYNKDLSQKRANTVRIFLAQNQQFKARLEVLAQGEWDLLCTDDTENCHALNRRVEVRLIAAQ